MEENTVRVNENEGYEPETEVSELSESSGNGALIAGIVGGFLACAMISGTKKLAAFMRDKLAERKQTGTVKDAVEVEYTEVPDKQTDSEEKPETK